MYGTTAALPKAICRLIALRSATGPATNVSDGGFAFEGCAGVINTKLPLTSTVSVGGRI